MSEQPVGAGASTSTQAREPAEAAAAVAAGLAADPTQVSATSPALAFGLEPFPLDRRYARLLVRVCLTRELSTSRLPRIRSAADVHRDFAGLASLDREAFVSLLLDQKNRVTGVHVVSVGSLNASLVHPREVFKSAILGNAAALIVLHNHPSGDPTPSREDRGITRRLRTCGETLGIPVVDHVVVAADGYRSFAECGLL